MFKICIRRFLEDDSGVAIVEYGLVVALVAIVISATVTSIGANIHNVFLSIATVVH